MKNLYNEILKARSDRRKLLAILLDPDKIDVERLDELTSRINESPATYIFIGGSHVESSIIDDIITGIKSRCSLPLILFPGNPSQISAHAHGILFLSLLSGRNPDYLIGHQVAAAPIIRQTDLEVIPTGYILVDGGTTTAVETVSKTSPMPTSDAQAIVNTALAGEMLGCRIIYLEAGSGAQKAVPIHLISNVSGAISVPLIVGGGIRSAEAIQAAYAAGADLVVIGTAFENDPDFFNKHPF